MITEFPLRHRGIWTPINLSGLGGLALAAALIPLPAAAQVRIEPGSGGGQAAICSSGGVIGFGDEDGCDSFPVYYNETRIRVGPDGRDVILDGVDGLATFNGGAIFNGGAQFNGQANFTGFTTVDQLNTNSINNAGNLTTRSINTGSLAATGNGSFGGSLTSNSFATGLAEITELRTSKATFNSSVTISGKLAITPGTTIDAGGNRIQNIGAPIAGTDAANKDYVDSAIESVAGNVTNLTNQVNDQGTRITAVEATNVQQDTRLTNVETVNKVQDTRLTSVENVNSVQNTRLDSVETENVTQNTRLTSVEARNLTQDTRMTAIEAVNTVQSNQISTLQDQVGGLQTSVSGLRRNIQEANGGIAAAVALGGTMIVPDSALSMSFNLATYRGQQGFSGAVVGRLSPKVYVNAGVGGSTVRGSTAGRVGISFGL